MDDKWMAKKIDIVWILIVPKVFACSSFSLKGEGWDEGEIDCQNFWND